MSQYTYSQIPDYAQDYLHYCQYIRNISEKTVNEYFLDLRIFFRFIKIYKTNFPETDFDSIDASDISLQILKTIGLSDLYIYLNFLHEERHEQIAARSRKISSLRTFFKYMCKQGYLDENPTTFLDSPKKPKELPVYLSLDECMSLLESIDGANRVRNFAIITLFLNCGLRLSELVGINLKDITGKTLRVRGKGGKARDVYLNQACSAAIEEYIKIRPKDGIAAADRDALFISRNKKRISNRMVQTLVKEYLEKANLNNSKYSTHKLRHTAATLMHQNGVDIRVLQEVLGHANLGTTQIYTHLENKQIQQAIENNPLSSVKIDGKKEKN